jgi:hypothetical protein
VGSRRKRLALGLALVGVFLQAVGVATVLWKRTHPRLVIRTGLAEPYLIRLQEDGRTLTVDLPQRTPREQQLWSLDTGEGRRSRTFPEYGGQFIDWCARNDNALNNTASRIRVVSLSTGKVVGDFSRGGEGFVVVGFVPGADLLAAGIRDRIELVSFEGKVLQTVRRPTGDPERSVFASFDGSAELIVAEEPTATLVWSTRDGQLVARLPIGNIVGVVGGSLVLLADLKTVRIHRIPTGEVVRELVLDDDRWESRLCDSAERLAIVSRSKVSVYSVETGERLWRRDLSPAAGDLRIPRCALSTHGERLALGFEDGRVEVWDLPR